MDGWLLNTLRPRQNGRQFPDDIFKCIFFSENISLSIEISLKFVPKGRIKNIPALVPTMAWHRPGDKPLSEPMMASLLMHIRVTPPDCVMIVILWGSIQYNDTALLIKGLLLWRWENENSYPGKTTTLYWLAPWHSMTFLRRQTITRTNAELLQIRSTRTNFSSIW